MNRTPTSSAWLLPLFSGTELPARDGLTAPLPDFLPGPPPWALTGLVLWLDAAAGSSLKVDGAGGVYRWVDRSGSGHDAKQARPALRAPLAAGNPFDPHSLDVT